MKIFFSNFKLASYFLKVWPKTKIFGQKTKNIQTNREVRILINLQCVIYQWIRQALQTNGKLFFKFQNHFSN